MGQRCPLPLWMDIYSAPAAQSGLALYYTLSYTNMNSTITQHMEMYRQLRRFVILYYPEAPNRNARIT